MATLAELHGIYVKGNPTNEVLFNRVIAAVLVVADTIRSEGTGITNHVNRLKWAKRAWASPQTVAQEMWGALLGADLAFTVAQITGASETAVIDAVKNAVDVFADGSA